MNLSLASLALGVLIGAADPVFARCELKIEKLGSVVLHAGRGNDYDPFDPSQYVVVEEFEIEHEDDGCDFFVTFSASEGGSFSRTMRRDGAALRYQIYDSVNLQAVLKDLPHASASEVISGSFAKGEHRRRLQFAVAIPPNQFVPRGEYDDRITLTAYEGTLNSNTRRDAKSIRVRTKIRSAVQLSLVPSGGGFDPGQRAQFLDLGELSEGKTAQVDLLVRNNTGYEIIFESENRGALKHLDATETSAIRYEMRVRGIPVTLTDKKDKLDGVSGVSALQGDRYPIQITIGALGQAMAGTYRDDITITVRAD
jgi:spore coat protein U-like protein